MQLKINWDVLLNAPSVATCVKQLESYLKEFNGNYFVDRVRSHKIIKDGVWGTVSLTPFECVLLDAPSLQRLRFIRQLGTSYLIYPTVGYSRFEHVLGVLQTVQNVLVSIRHNAEIANTAGELSDRLKIAPLIRVAALLHDAMHGPFSHISERVLEEEDEGTKKLLNTFREELDQGYQAAEIYSALLCLCEPFKSVLDNNSMLPSCVPECANSRAIASVILGIPPGTFKNLFAAQIINSVYDVDKIDYMSRESNSAKLPLPLDVSRLISKFEVRRLKATKLPKHFSNQLGADDEVFALGTGISGAGCLDEIYLSRVWLYDRLYLHHKTRAAEELVMALMREILRDSTPGRLLAMTDEDVLRFSGTKENEQLARLQQQLRNRDLPVRCFCFALRHLERAELTVRDPDVGDVDRDQDNSLLQSRRNQLTKETKGIAARSQLLDKIFSEYKRICILLGSPVTMHRDELFLVSPGVRFIQEEDTHFIFGQDSELVKYERTALLAPERWSEAYSRRKDAGYVFAPAKARLEVLIACEAVFFDMLKVGFHPDSQRSIKVNGGDLVEKKDRLAQKEFYKNRSKIKPIPTSLRTNECDEKLESLARRYPAFDRAADGGIWYASDQFRNFLKQFPSELAPHMIDLLCSGTYLTKDKLAESIMQLLPDVDTAFGLREENVHICPLGELKDSAPHFSRSIYQAISDQPRYHLIEPGQMRDLRENSVILFFDDIISTGSQVTSILSDWTGLEGPKLLTETRHSVIDSEQFKRFRTGFIFAFGSEQGKKVLDEFCLANFGKSPFLKWVSSLENEFNKVAAHNELREWLRKVGVALLTSTKGKQDTTNWNEKRIADCALGYGNKEAVIVFPYNPPTVTLTALWLKGGEFNGEQWIPLFPRIDKV